MAYASRSGRAQTNPSIPRAFAVCQRCGIWHNRSDLQWQYQWGGASLINLRILVCRECLDRPQEQLRSLALPADPVPVDYPVVEPFLLDESGNNPVIGQPVGLEQAAIPPLAVAPDGTIKHYGVPLNVLSITSNGTNTVSVTCSSPHGLATNDQIAVEGLTDARATGFFSVVVATATALNYVTALPVPANSLLTPNTRIVNALVGLPRGVTTIPQVV